MRLFVWICAFIALVSVAGVFPGLVDVAFAADPQATPAPSSGSAIGRLIPLFLMVTVVYYLFVISPQKKEQKAQKDLMESLKQGDSVLTAAGIIGRVAGIEKDYILLEIAANTKVKFVPDQIRKKL